MMKNFPMPVRLHGRKKTSSVAPDLTQDADVAATSFPGVAETTPPKVQIQRHSAKEEIRDAIDAADRSLSKCYATLRRLRTKLKN